MERAIDKLKEIKSELIKDKQIDTATYIGLANRVDLIVRKFCAEYSMYEKKLLKFKTMYYPNQMETIEFKFFIELIIDDLELNHKKDELINKPIIENKKINSKKINSLKTSITPTKNSISQNLKDTVALNEVFIVHGHDEEAKVKAARFIEKMGFKPIILHEQASSGKTIIEKIERYSNVGFGIVLYTPCDVGGKQTDSPKLNSRARQNVVFEHGYLIGKIGRSNVCALVKGNIETPNDISGVVYVSMDDADAWHIKIAKELRNSGYSVDMNKL